VEVWREGRINVDQPWKAAEDIQRLRESADQKKGFEEQDLLIRWSRQLLLRFILFLLGLRCCAATPVFLGTQIAHGWSNSIIRKDISPRQRVLSTAWPLFGLLLGLLLLQSLLLILHLIVFRIQMRIQVSQGNEADLDEERR
jgi:hypothetical protein